MNHPSIEITKPSACEAQWVRIFKAPRDDVFKALTTPEIIKKWLLGPPGMSLPVCEIDLRVGGALRYVWRDPDGVDMGMSGVFRSIEAPRLIVHTELFDVDWTGGETVVTTELEDMDGATKMTCTVLYASEEARDAAVATGMGTGAKRSYDLLDELLPTLR